MRFASPGIILAPQKLFKTQEPFGSPEIHGESFLGAQE